MRQVQIQLPSVPHLSTLLDSLCVNPLNVFQKYVITTHS